MREHDLLAEVQGSCEVVHPDEDGVLLAGDVNLGFAPVLGNCSACGHGPLLGRALQLFPAQYVRQPLYTLAGMLVEKSSRGFPLLPVGLCAVHVVYLREGYASHLRRSVTERGE